MYGDEGCVIYEEEMIYSVPQMQQEADWRERARDGARRYVARPARRAYRTAADHPMATIGGILAIGALAALAYVAWQQYDRGSYRWSAGRGQRLGPLWNQPPRDPRGITMPSQREMYDRANRMDYATETEPSAASQID